MGDALRLTQGRLQRGTSRPDHDAKVLGGAAHTCGKQYASSLNTSSSDRKTESIRSVVHWKTVLIIPTTPLYPGPGGGYIIFQGPRPTGEKISVGGRVQGRLRRLLSHFPPRRPVILPHCTNRRCGWDRPTIRRRRRPRGPRSHR